VTAVIDPQYHNMQNPYIIGKKSYEGENVAFTNPSRFSAISPFRKVRKIGDVDSETTSARALFFFWQDIFIDDQEGMKYTCTGIRRKGESLPKEGALMKPGIKNFGRGSFFSGLDFSMGDDYGIRTAFGG